MKILINIKESKNLVKFGQQHTKITYTVQQISVPFRKLIAKSMTKSYDGNRIPYCSYILWKNL